MGAVQQRIPVDAVALHRRAIMPSLGLNMKEEEHAGDRRRDRIGEIRNVR